MTECDTPYLRFVAELQPSPGIENTTTGMSYETDIVIGSQPFNTLRESDFRRLIVPHTGVLPRMELESRSDVAIFYAKAISKSGDSEQVQVLLVTIVDFPTRATFLVVHWPD